MPEVFTKKYIKRLLDREVLKKVESDVQSIDNMHDNHSLINIRLILWKITQQSI